MSEFNPTHTAPEGGTASWEGPDPSRPSARLEQWTPVEVVERRGAWARIVCSNGWGAWVDDRRLVETGAAAAPAAVPTHAPGFSLPPSLSKGAIISLAGAGAVLLSTVLPWFSFGGGSGSAFKLPLQVLFSPRTQSSSGTLGVVVLLVALVAGGSVFLPQIAKYRRAAAVVLAAVPVLYFISIVRAVSGSPVGPLSVVGLGTYLCLAGSIALFAGEAAIVAVGGGPRPAPTRGTQQPSTAPHSPAAPAPVFQRQPATAGWAGTHRAPASGLQTWPAADPSSTPGPRIGGGLDVRLLEARNDWAYVECANGWRAWVDARLLESR